MVRTLLAVLGVTMLGTQSPAVREGGIFLDDLAGAALKEVLASDPVVVIPIGRTLEPHPPHLKINADWRLVAQMRHHIAGSRASVAAPLTHFPAPSALMPYAAAVLVDICRTLAHHGARRFLVIDVFRSPVATAVIQSARDDGLALAFEPVVDADARHGERDETLLLAELDPGGIFNSKDVDADPVRARQLLESAIQRMRAAIDRLRTASLPPKKVVPRPVEPQRAASARPQGGTEGDYRTIVRLAGLFSAYWRLQDAPAIGSLFAEDGDVRHPDGLVERGSSIIASNRAKIFGNRAYANSRHPLQVATVTFRGPDVAVADGTWELVGVRDQPSRHGPFTWVVTRTEGTWKIAAWRYADGDPALTSLR